MLFASEFLDRLLIYGVLGLVFVGLPVAVIGGVLFYRHQQRWTQRAFARIYNGLNTHVQPHAGDVVVQYDTYHGFLVFNVHTAHHAVLPVEDARTLLRRLLWFNLTWGLFAWGSLLIVPLAIFNYIGQQRSVTHQHLAATLSPAPVDLTNPYASPMMPAVPDPPQAQRAIRPSAIMVIAGVICYGLGVLFLLSGVVSAVMLRGLPAVMNFILGAFLISTGYHLLRSPPPP